MLSMLIPKQCTYVTWIDVVQHIGIN